MTEVLDFALLEEKVRGAEQLERFISQSASLNGSHNQKPA
jgi:hypothetical protein